MFSNVENIAELKKSLSEKTVEELEELLALDFDESNEGAVNADYIRTILEVIEEKEPQQRETREKKTAAAWHEFKAMYTTRTYSDEENDRLQPNYAPQTHHHLPGHRCTTQHSISRKIKNIVGKGLVAAVIVTLLCSVGFGFEFWNDILNWTYDTFNIETGKDTTTMPGTAVFDSIKFAVSDLVDVTLIPTIAPEDTQMLGNIRTNVRKERTVIGASYAAGDREFTIQVIIHADKENASLVYQKNDKDIEEEYVANGVTHYIFSNEENVSAVWLTEGVEVLIQGNLTIDELKEMIDSIY